MPEPCPALYMTLEEAKRALRVEAAARRRKAQGMSDGRTGERLRDRFKEAIRLDSGAIISGYWPIGDELDLRPLLLHLHARGHVLGLPVVVGRGRPLIFRAWQPKARLVPGSYGIPTPSAETREVTPDLLLVPLLAFDRQGYRLGYGGGYYDLTLKHLRAARRALAVGVGYAAQEVASVPHDETDETLDWVVTEAEAMNIHHTREAVS